MKTSQESICKAENRDTRTRNECLQENEEHFRMKEYGRILAVCERMSFDEVRCLAHTLELNELTKDCYELA